METTIEQSKRPGLGKLALAICLGGTVLTVAIALAKRFLGDDALTWAGVLFVAFQLAALVLGIVARREPLGRASAITAGILLLAFLLLVPNRSSHSQVGAPPSEPPATPDSVKPQ